MFAGAGVSRPSGLPTSRTLIDDLLATMVESLSAIALGRGEERDAVRDVIRGLPLERLLDSLRGLHGDHSINLYLRVLANAHENYNHDAVADLARRGMLKQIVTLNFDNLYEQALARRGISFRWQLPLASDQYIPNSGGQVTILKPHGTLEMAGLPYADHFLAATLESTGIQPQPENGAAIRTMAQTGPVLLVVGYSDSDWDIFPLIAAGGWSGVVWCHYVSPDRLDAPLHDEPSSGVMAWLRSSFDRHAYLLYGDPRSLMRALCEGATYGRDWAWPTLPERKPESSVFRSRPYETAFAAIRLLDGRASHLYGSLLTEFGQLSRLQSDPQLRREWRRSMAWYLHAHLRDPRGAITLQRELLKSEAAAGSDNLRRLRDLRSLYYEYISLAKRPYLNPAWPWHLVSAYRVATRTRQEVMRLRRNPETTRWTNKLADQELAYLSYYKIDLYHNWGYPLLLFRNRVARRIARAFFSWLARCYAKAAQSYPLMDWEYRYVRRIEALLIAGDAFPRDVSHRLDSIADMFARIGEEGHLAYVRTIQALIHPARSPELFAREEANLVDRETLATPASMVRMRVFRRFFFPSTLSFRRTARDVWEYSRKQERHQSHS